MRLPLLLLALLIQCFVGCSALPFPYRAGDLYVTENYSGPIERTISPGVLARRWAKFKFPAVSLDKAQTSIFRVRGYHKVMAPSITLELPKPTPDEFWQPKEPSPWEYCDLRISVLTVAGEPLATQRIHLGALPWPKADSYSTETFRPRAGGVFPLYEIRRAVRGRADYDLQIEVEKPSTSSGATVRVTGESSRY